MGQRLFLGSGIVMEYLDRLPVLTLTVGGFLRAFRPW
jgi:hypothetical protein